jgi:hypothetical protein
LGEDLRAEQLDALEEGGLRHAADVHLHDLAGVAEQLVQMEDALGDLVGPAANTIPPASRSAVRFGGDIPGRPISAAPVWNMRRSCSR